MADAFVDSIGVNTHFGFGGIYYNSLTQTRLGASGIRHIRDVPGDAGFSIPNNLFVTYGIRTLICKGSSYNIIPYLNYSYVEAAEGVNEPELSGFSCAGLYDSGAELDFAATRCYQWDLFAARPAGKPLLSPAVGWAKNAGTLEFLRFDKMAFHPYLNGQKPGHPLIDQFIPEIARLAVAGQSQQPIWATEAGYHNAANSTTGHRPVTETAGGKYVPRLLAGHFNRGIERTYLYEFADEGTSLANVEDRFGLIRNDFTQKPAYWGVKNLIAILSDPGSSFDAGALHYTLGGNTSDVQHTLLRKRNGEFYLLLWQESQSCLTTLNYDSNNKPVATPPADISVPGAAVTLTFNSAVSSAVVYSQLDNSSYTTSATYSNPSSINLSIPDEMIVVKIVGAAGSGPSGIPLPPSGPDLIIDRITTIPAEPKPGDVVTIRATVKNQGTATAPTTSTVTFYLDGAGSINWSAYAGNLAIGASTTVTANGTYTAEAGYHTLRVIADTYNSVSETNELNNYRSAAFPVVTDRYFDPCAAFGSNWTVTPYSSGATWSVATINGQSCFHNGYGTALGTITHPLGATVSSNWKLDFDYDWQFGDAAWGLYLYADMLDASGSGYRLAVHQGDSNTSSNTYQQIEIFRMNGGVQGVRLGAGSGYDQAGWYPQAGPRLKHVRLIYDRSMLTVSAYIDLNKDGVLDQVIPPVRDAGGTTSFTRLVMQAWDSQGASCRPVLDNIQIDTGVLDLVPVPFFTDPLNDLSKWSVDSPWTLASVNNETFATNTGFYPTGKMTRVIAPAVNSDWNLSFDYDWYYGGDPDYGLYHGNYGLAIYADVLDNANSGYRLIVHQGDNGSSSLTPYVIEVYRMNNGVQASARAGSGSGYNERGWKAPNLPGPAGKRVCFSYNKANKTLSAFVDVNRDGAMERVTAAIPDDSPVTNLTRIVFSATGEHTCMPLIDNVQLGLLP